MQEKHILIRRDGTINGHSARILIDSGATHDFVTVSFLEKTNLVKNTFSTPGSFLKLADDYQTHSTCYLDATVVMDDFTSSVRLFSGIVSDAHDVILGKSWLYDENPDINWRTNSVKPRSIPSPMEVQYVSHCASNKLINNLYDDGFVVLHSEKIIFDGENATVPGLTQLLDEYNDCFPDDLPPGLPPKRHVDHAIPLEPGSKPPAQRLYRLSTRELAELKKTLDDLLAKGWIRPSNAPYGSPVLFVSKKDGSLRMVVDYRALNMLTIKDKYPLVRTDDLIAQLRGARILSKLDLRSGYHQIRLRKEDQDKTSFLTRYGSYAFTVLPFGLTSAPGTFMRLMQDIFRDLLDVCVIIYLDDILIYSKSTDDHLRHLRDVLTRLRRHKLYAKSSKCEFGKTELEFLGHIVSGDKVKCDPHKLDAIKKWPTLKNIADVQSFLGLCNFYRQYCHGYATVSAPLTRLLRKDVPWEWDDNCEKAFVELKRRLTTAPVLALPDPDRHFYLHTDAASTVAIGGILSQVQDDGLLHPVAYASRTLKSAELNYPVHEQELLAVSYCIDQWRHHLDDKKFTVYTDNRAISTMHSKSKNLSKRQIRLLEKLMSYRFDVHHIPREENTGADALSKRPPSEPSHPDVSMELYSIVLSVRGETFGKDCAKHYADDSFWADILSKLRTNDDNDEYSLDDGIIYRNMDGRRLLCVPRMPTLLNTILHDAHDAPVAGHRGIDATMERLCRTYFWPHMNKTVRRYIATCDLCQRTKSTNQKPAGLLQPLQIAEGRWTSISVDFIVHLPKTPRHFDAIAVFVDRFSKRAHFAPCKTTDTAEDFAHLFLREIYRQHGLPNDIVSDRDVRFTSKFWTALTKLLGVQRRLSSSMHAESDGQTERTNRSLEDMLRRYVAYNQKDWDEWLPVLEHTYNDTKHASIKLTPFYADLGRHVSPALRQGDDAVNNAYADALAKRLDAIRTDVTQSIKEATERQAMYANRKRRDLVLEVGNQVLVKTAHLNPDVYSNAPTKKLLPRWAGPYKILKRIDSVAYKLDLPATIKAHNVFHVSALKEYLEPDDKDRRPERPPPVITNSSDDEFEVEVILDDRIRRNKLQYLVKWKGYPLHEATWEPATHLENAPKILQEYLTSKQQPAKDVRDDVSPPKRRRGRPPKQLRRR